MTFRRHKHSDNSMRVEKMSSVEKNFPTPVQSLCSQRGQADLPTSGCGLHIVTFFQRAVWKGWGDFTVEEPNKPSFGQVMRQH